MALVPFPNPASEPPATEDDLDKEWSQEAEGGGKMSFLEHLDELRKRIIRSLLFIIGGFLICCFFIQQLFDFIMRPMQQLLPPGQTLVYTEPGEAFVLWIKIAAIGGLLLASPGVFSQVWMFIAPGLYQHEKKLAIPFVVLSTTFFLVGAAFSHYVVFPMTWKFFVGFSNDYLTFMPRIEPAFGMYLKLMLGMGLVFQMPTLVLFLSRMGVLTARFMLKNFKYAFLIIFIAAAFLTPGGDPMSQAAMATPMVILYLISILIAWIFGKKKRTTDEEEEALAD
jgi:sec-independent protein translocase protein TatC